MSHGVPHNIVVPGFGTENLAENQHTETMVRACGHQISVPTPGQISGSMEKARKVSQKLEESSRRSQPADIFYVRPEHGNCPGCGCALELYEIQACRLRGLKRPVCVGCLASAVVVLRDVIYPLFEEFAKRYFDLAIETGIKEVKIDLPGALP